jgi:hypothetical protein
MTGFPLLIGAPSRFPRRELARLTPKSDLEKYRRAPNLPAEGRKLASVETTEDAVLPALQEAGATGLEPATSGVTGRHGETDYSRLRPGMRDGDRPAADNGAADDRATADRDQPSSGSPCSSRPVLRFHKSGQEHLRDGGTGFQSRDHLQARRGDRLWLSDGNLLVCHLRVWTDSG